jgi:hypothetical protein
MIATDGRPTIANRTASERIREARKHGVLKYVIVEVCASGLLPQATYRVMDVNCRYVGPRHDSKELAEAFIVSLLEGRED